MLPSPIDTSLSYHPFKTTPTSLTKNHGSNSTNYIRKSTCLQLIYISYPFLSQNIYNREGQVICFNCNIHAITFPSGCQEEQLRR